MKLLVIYPGDPLPEGKDGLSKIIQFVPSEIKADLLCFGTKMVEHRFNQIISVPQYNPSRINLMRRWLSSFSPKEVCLLNDWMDEVSKFLEEKGEDYDIIHIVSSALSPLIAITPPELSSKMILSSVDAMSMLFERRARFIGLIKGLPFLVESVKWREIEKRYGKCFPINHVVSSVDKKYLEHQGLNNVFALPNGVIPVKPGLKAANPRIIFWGDLGYAPNKAAAEFIVREIAPLVKIPVVLIGRGEQIANPPSNVQYLGFVDDLYGSISDQDIFLSPMFFGSGLKNKMLEAMTLGLPIIASQITTHGIPVQDGVDCYILDDDNSNQWQQRIEQVLNRWPTEMIARSKELVETSFSWDQRREQMLSKYFEIIQMRREEKRKL